MQEEASRNGLNKYIWQIHFSEYLLKYTDESRLSGRRIVISAISLRISLHFELCNAFDLVPNLFCVSSIALIVFVTYLP